MAEDAFGMTRRLDAPSLEPSCHGLISHSIRQQGPTDVGMNMRQHSSRVVIHELYREQEAASDTHVGHCI
eukprot:7986779-Heterocapsa_arctica.AAC.1